jgi:hypothetical protein
MLSCRKWLTHKISDRLASMLGPAMYVPASRRKKPTLENAEMRRRGGKKIWLPP